MTQIKPEQIRWRVGSISKSGDKGMLLGYIDSRTAMDLLDGLDFEWRDEYRMVKVDDDEGIECALTVKGITRTDVGTPSNTEGLKGAYSDALKRAAVKHGIGRELYELPRIWVTVDQFKRPTAEPAFRNGRWTLPSGSGSVIYDHEPMDQPEQRGGSKPSSPRAALAQPAGDLRDAVAAAAAEHGLDHDALGRLADEVGVTKGQRANADQLRAILARIEQPAAQAPAGGGDEEARASSPPTETPHPEGSPDSSGSAAATVSAPVSPAVEPAPAPTMDDILAVTGGEEVPPKPGTDEYRLLPSGAERAKAKAYWEAQKVTS